jgi:uncharacterized protein
VEIVLKLNIADIGEEGIRFERDLDTPAVRALLQSTGVGKKREPLELADGEASAEVRLWLTRMDSTVFVRGSMRGAFVVPCRRCLQPAPVALQDDGVALTFLPREAFAIEGDEIELDVDDLDTYAHDGETLEIGDLLREHLMLAAPIAPLCREDCPGIAPEGGADTSAEAGETTSNSGWKAKLEQLRGSLGGAEADKKASD